VTVPRSSPPEAEWALALFNRSVLKQAKLRQIVARLDDPAGKRGLDIGADNGVISYLLRQRGGQWHSADLDARAVQSIRQLVGSDVHQIDGGPTPFENAAFDQVVIVDFLEHIADDRGFARELARIVKPGGQVIINVPHLKPGSLLNRVRHAIGLTDEWHGHLRPGYSLEGLRQLLGPAFDIEESSTYSGAFSELIDTALNGLYLRIQRRQSPGGSSSKGTVITESDMRKHRKQFLLLSALYPLIWGVAKLDALLFFTPGYKLIVSARRVSSAGGAVAGPDPGGM
jgi:SAM-dependent methyltransferase